MIRNVFFGFTGFVTVAAFVAILQTPNRNQPDSHLRQEQDSELDAEKRLVELGLNLPEPSASLAIYRKIVVVGNMAYLSGHLPAGADGQVMTGKAGRDVDVDQAAAAARQCGIALLATLRHELGSLNRVRRLVKTTGMVNSTDDFTRHPEVINGCSQLFVDVFGADNGKGARAAVGMSSLPRGAICEIEMMFELNPGSGS